jgi:hypothetical protein
MTQHPSLVDEGVHRPFAVTRHPSLVDEGVHRPFAVTRHPSLVDEGVHRPFKGIDFVRAGYDIAACEHT